MRQHTEIINAPADYLKCTNIVPNIILEVFNQFLSTFVCLLCIPSIMQCIQSDNANQHSTTRYKLIYKARKSRDEFWQGLEILESFSSQVSINELESRKKTDQHGKT